MNKRETVGNIFGIIGTISLANLQLALGCLALIVGILLNLPKAVSAWRAFLYDYRTWKEETGSSGVLTFPSYLMGLRVSKKDRSQLELPFPRRNED